MTQTYKYMAEDLETIRAKTVLNFQQQKSLAKLGELSLNENNIGFMTIIKKYENLKSRVNKYLSLFF